MAKKYMSVFSILVTAFCLNVTYPARVVAESDEFEQEGQYVDRELYPEAYGLLTSDRLMFPVYLGDWPLKIDSRRQLFVDDYLVASTEGLKREWHQPVKHPGNPIMSGEFPWEGHCIIPLAIHHEPGTGMFRMWYSCRVYYKGPGGIPVRHPTLYAESQDGLTWHRPKLGLLEYKGSAENNLVIHGGRMAGLFENPNPSRPEERYATLVVHRPDYVEREGYYLYTSPDGIHWAGDLTRWIIPSHDEWRMPLDGIADTTIIRYDPVLGLYVCDAKFVLPPQETKMRCRGQCESEDLIHWTRPRFTLYPDEHDEPDSQIYGNISFVYESMWLGLCRIMHTDRTGWKQVEVELSLSRDGYHWTRPTDRRPFIPFGEPDSWEPDYTDPVHSGPLLIGDELWFYYRGTRHSKRDNIANPEDYDMKLGLARLRRDGFASLSAGQTPGTVVTRPLTFSGQRLFVNAEVGEGGWVKAAVLTRDREPITSYELADSVPLEHGTTKGQMIWTGIQNLAPPEKSHVRLMLQLKSARLYAFWIE